VFGHQVVTPSQVTCPRSPAEQLRSAAEQLVVLLLPWQEIGPVSQLAVALQRAFSRPALGRFAATGTALGVPQEPALAGDPRIMLSAADERGVGEGVWAKQAIETRRRTQAKIHGFFTVTSLMMLLI